jgi:cell division protein FtsB
LSSRLDIAASELAAAQRELARLRAENERLRQALEDLLNAKPFSGPKARAALEAARRMP